MYCRNCGNNTSPNVTVCYDCGVHPSKGQNYCQQCGNATFSTDKVCVNCGNQLIGAGKDWLTTLLLLFFFGVFGVHRFYTGNIGIGILQLVTGGGCGIWWVIDLVMILTGSYKDSNGNALENKQM